MGRKLRELLVGPENKLRVMTLEDILTLLRNYHRAREPGAPDQQTIMELMNECRDTPKMSRTTFWTLVRKICDSELQADMVRQIAMNGPRSEPRHG